MPFSPQVWKNGVQSMNSRNVARGKLSSTRTPVKAGTGRSSARHSIGVRLERAVSRGTTSLTWRGVGFAERLVVGTMLRHEHRLALLTQQTGRHRYGAAGIQHMDTGSL